MTQTYRAMVLSGREPETRSLENPTVPVSAENFMAFFGIDSGSLPAVTIDSALKVPAVAAAVNFLSATLANLPLPVFKADGETSVRARDAAEELLNEAPNPEWTSYAWRKYVWQQTFTGGRGPSWLERRAGKVVAIWPMEPTKTRIKRVAGRRVYVHDGRDYPAADVIDVPFMLKRDQLGAYGPIQLGSKAIQLALALNDYASGFFAGGGVPPLALTGPMPAGADAVRRAQSDIQAAIAAARASGSSVFPIPSGYELKPVGTDPEKGQMTDARRFQVEEFARLWSLPPVFLQDLTHGTFSNTEQQDLHLVKHTVAQWAKAFEEEVNLKMFGRGPGPDRRDGRWAEHNLDGLMRGDFKSRIEGLARGVQSAILTPDEARALENRPKLPHGDKLYIQGATVPLGSQPLKTPSTDNNGGAQ